MKKDLLLFAGLGLIGYGLWKFLTPRSSSTGLGSPFFSSGTARIPSALGAAKPGAAPVLGRGYSTANPPQEGTDILPLVQGAIAAANSAYEFGRRIFTRRDPIRDDPYVTGYRTDQTLSTGYNPGSGGTSYGSPGFSDSIYVPNSAIPNAEISTNSGFDSIDTSDVGSIA